MSNKRSVGRVLSLDDDEAEDKFYRLKVFLPNSTSVTLALTNPELRMSMNNFVNLVKEEYEKTCKNGVLSGKKRKRVDWNLAAKYYLEFNGEKIKEIVRFDKFKPDLCNVLRLDISKTARTKNPSQSEEYNPSELVKVEEQEQVFLGDDNEETKQISMDSEEETEPLRPLKMYFSPSDYLKPFKIGTKCYIHQAVNILESHLSSEEKKWFWEHPQFKHFFHMHTDSNHKVMAMWMLLLRTACVDKKKECWFVVNGVPIRYSLQELALISGLYCHSYPKNYEAFGSLGFSGKHFGAGATVTYAKVKTKLLSMKKSSRERLKMAVLFFLCSVIIGKRKTGEKAEAVEDFFLKSVEDLEWCKTFPWGRLAFDKNMKDIDHLIDHFDGELGASWVFPSFVMPLELLAFETIPNLMNKFRNHVREADPECPRMCKMKFKASSMKGFPISELYDTLGTTKEIKSIMLPSPSEKGLLKQIMDDEVGHDDVDDVIVDGWTKRIIKENKPICFEELHIQDVSSREIEANPKNADVVGVRVGRKKVALKKVSEKGIFEQLQKQLEDGLKRIDMKIDDMDTRLTYVESCVKNLKEAKDTKGEKEDGEKEKELEENDLDEDETETDKEKEKEDESSEKRSKVERMYGRKRTRTTTAKEQEEKGEEIQVGFQETSERGRKKAKLTWKKVDIKGVTADQGNSITTNERVVVEPSSKVGNWKLASNLKSTRQYNVQLVSSLPPCSIARFDEYENKIEFSSLPTLEVNHGPLKHVVEIYPEALENLLPGSTVQNYILEMFDGYNNHAAEGTNVLICIEGFCINDSMGLNRKVNSCGCIDLSGLLEVTAGYGKTISLSVMSGIDEIFKKESLIERRELRLLTKMPEFCVAGSNLTNLIFKVTDSDGVMDTSIHHDEKSGCFHTMSIKTDSSSYESEIRYAFVHGSCKVPTLSLPEREGVFSFKVFHSRFPELHLSLKIQLTPAQILQRDETSYSRMGLTPKSKMASTTYSPALSSQTGPSLRDVAQFTESFKENLIGYSEHRVEIDERLHCLEAEQNQAKEELRTLQASLEPLGAMFPECLSTKESMMKQIEEKHHDTAASVFCCLYRKSPPPQSLFLSKKGVFGLVALLGSVASTSLSRVLSEYLGEDMLLALVCKSAQIGPNNAEFLRLQSNHRFHVLCLDAIRAWKDGILENDPQKKLAMDDPELPNGDPIPGFKGYAVNMIDLAPEELTIQTNSGYGLRETLFYNLFGNLQVYETQKQVEAALPHINGCGAVSLDGFIAKENGFVYSGCSKPEIHFPITVKEDDKKRS